MGATRLGVSATSAGVRLASLVRLPLQVATPVGLPSGASQVGILAARIGRSASLIGSFVGPTLALIAMASRTGG